MLIRSIKAKTMHNFFEIIFVSFFRRSKSLKQKLYFIVRSYAWFWINIYNICQDIYFHLSTYVCTIQFQLGLLVSISLSSRKLFWLVNLQNYTKDKQTHTHTQRNRARERRASTNTVHVCNIGCNRYSAEMQLSFNGFWYLCTSSYVLFVIANLSLIRCPWLRQIHKRVYYILQNDLSVVVSLSAINSIIFLRPAPLPYMHTYWTEMRI